MVNKIENTSDSPDNLIINEHQMMQVVFIIRGVKKMLKTGIPFALIDYLQKQGVLEQNRTWNKGSLKYLNQIEKKFANKYKQSFGKQLR